MPEDSRTAPLEKAVHEGMRSSLVGIGSNLALAAFKCVAGFLGHSFALVADGVESFSDVVSSTVVFFGLKFAIKPPDEEHPYGHGKAEPIASIVVSLALIVAAVFIAVESIQRIEQAHPLPLPYTLWVLLAVVGVKVALSQYVTAVGKGLEGSAIESDAWHHLSDAITSSFAFIGISVALWTRNPAADDWAALCASPIIIFNAYRQLRHPPLAELLDAKPSPEIERQIRSIASKVLGVIGLEKCEVRKVGFSYYVNLHVIVHGEISVSQGHSIAHQVEDTVLRYAPRVAEVIVHIEPDEEDQVEKLRGSQFSS
jgi:cation diffusion facilitator family transporter